MKKLIHFAAICLTVTTGITLSSCQKATVKPKTSTTPPGPAVGYWYGTFINNNGFGAPEGILFRSDGTLKMYDFFGASSTTDTTAVSLIATGTYTVSSGVVKFSYTFPGESFTAQGTLNISVSPSTLPYTFTDPSSVPLSGTGTFSQQSK